MESLNVDELMSQIQEEGPDAPKAGCFYSKDGDCVFCHVEDVPYYAERVDALLTVYLAEEDDRLVGAQIKGVSKLPRHDALGVELQRQGSVEIVKLLLLTFQNQPKPAPEDASVIRRKAKYFDVVTRLRDFSLSSADLQLT